VAALLRLQARRIDSAEAKGALEEAVRRVGSIAIVHETLSQAVEEIVDFDEIADRIGGALGDVGGVGAAVRVRREGSFGGLDSEIATPLAMVLTELLQNAVEHGYPEGTAASVGRILMTVRREAGRLEVTVDDDGCGLPPDFDLTTSTHLGLSIVGTLVESELGGRLELADRPDAHGARARISVPVA
jgi:two-component sensor histidine kinase